MGDLIKFDNEISKRAVSPKLDAPVLQPIKLSTCIAKPPPPTVCDIYDDPFDPFEPQENSNEMPELTDGSLFSFDCFSNATNDSSHLPASHESTVSGATSHKTVASRSHSDTSTISSKSARPTAKINRSVDDMGKRQQQLLKLSFFNSPNSPMHSSSFMNSTIAESVFKEAKSIAKKFGDYSDLSFEDLNNISQHLIDASGDLSVIDTDLQDMKINIPNEQREQHPTSSPDKAKLHEQLQRIKKEVDAEDTEKTEEEVTSKTDESEVDELWQKLKSVINEGNKDEAKKQLLRLNEALGKKETKNTMEVQPIIRQATFEIDPVTGRRKEEVKEPPEQTVVSNDLLRQLAALLNGQAAGVHALDLPVKDAGAKVAVVFVPTPVATPSKNQRLAVPTASRTQSAIKPPSDKKQGTPLKRLTQSSRRVSFTNPRPLATAPKPLERVGAVRKSLMGSIDSQKSKVSPSAGVKPLPRRPVSSAAPRRSVSLKLPDVQLTKPSPVKTSAIRPSTGEPYNKRLSQVPATAGRAPPLSRLAPVGRSRTMSEQKKPVSEFKAPSAVRKAAAASKGSLV